jgi:hypothetical protein
VISAWLHPRRIARERHPGGGLGRAGYRSGRASGYRSSSGRGFVDQHSAVLWCWRYHRRVDAGGSHLSAWEGGWRCGEDRECLGGVELGGGAGVSEAAFVVFGFERCGVELAGGLRSSATSISTSEYKPSPIGQPRTRPLGPHPRRWNDRQRHSQPAMPSGKRCSAVCTHAGSPANAYKPDSQGLSSGATALCEWAIPIQERRFADVTAASLQLAAAEDPAGVS